MPSSTFRDIRASGWTSLAERAALWLERYPGFVVSVLTALYLLASAYLAHLKPLWDDEFFSLYIARAGFRGAWTALQTGADQHPPTFYWLTYLFLKPFGFTHIVFRLPEILGFWVMLLSLFLIISRKTNNIIGYFAMVFPCLTDAYYYATEGRGYGLLLACTAAAYLCWEQVIAGNQRRITVPIFGLCLGAAVCCHYYGILILIPFGLGELVRLFERRRPDFHLWIAFAAPLIPLAAFLPVIRSSRGYSAHFWAVPWVGTIGDTFHLVFTSANTTLLYIVVTVFLFSSLGRNFPGAREERSVPRNSPFSLPEATVLLGMLALPVFGYLVGRFVTHGFTSRYAIACEIGATAVLAVAVWAWSRHSRSLQLALFLLVLVRFGMNVNHNRLMHLTTRRDIASTSQKIGHYVARDLPAAIAEVGVFHRLSFYGPSDLKGKIFYLLDADASVRYLGHDTIERGLADLKPWFHEDAVPYRWFVSRHPDFYVYGSIGNWNWLTFQLIDDRLAVKLIERDGDRLMFQVHDPLGGVD